MAVQASKSISLTELSTGKAFDLSAANIINFTAINAGADSQITFLNSFGRVITKEVAEAVATINTAAARTQAVTIDNAASTIIYLHSDKIIFVDALTANRQILYNASLNYPVKYLVTESAANINTAAGNTFAITIQETGATRYINNLFVGSAITEDVTDYPVVTFTTRVEAASGVIRTVGTGYTSPTVAITGGVTNPTGVLTTKVVTATIVAGGTGGTPGAVTITGTTGTGTRFQATGTINGGGVLTGQLVVTVAGNYSVPVTNIAIEPVTGGALSGCTVSVSLGLLAFTLTGTGGGYTAYPVYTITDATGVNGVVSANSEIESPMTIVSAGSNLNTTPTLTFSATTGTLATATATFDADAQNISATTVTQNGAYKKLVDAYPTLAITGGTGCNIVYDAQRAGVFNLQVAETKATVKAAINAL